MDTSLGFGNPGFGNSIFAASGLGAGDDPVVAPGLGTGGIGGFAGTGGGPEAVSGLGTGGVDGFEGTGGGPEVVSGLGTGGTGGVSGFGTAGVAGKFSSDSNPFGKPGSGSLIFSGIDLGGPPADGDGVSSGGLVFGSSFDGSTGLGNVSAESDNSDASRSGEAGVAGAGAVTFGMGNAASTDSTGMASMGSNVAEDEVAGKLANFAVIVST
ncbi:MAG: hypothetical protein QF685_00920 [Verrucomicrobiota bacterium]|nr:hypothetical protein [Verrucomicrobiota bacterium]